MPVVYARPSRGPRRGRPRGRAPAMDRRQAVGKQRLGSRGRRRSGERRRRQRAVEARPEPRADGLPRPPRLHRRERGLPTLGKIRDLETRRPRLPRGEGKSREAHLRRHRHAGTPRSRRGNRRAHRLAPDAPALPQPPPRQLRPRHPHRQRRRPRLPTGQNAPPRLLPLRRLRRRRGHRCPRRRRIRRPVRQRHHRRLRPATPQPTHSALTGGTSSW
mmetsp:Transcript_27391/g.88468  ORF Transcript_27391/g.88468 Transcript_27391/m.88468 type:complete len:217 (+) Transcript_27391:1144-1794(+)